MPPAQDNSIERICFPANWESGPAASYADTPSCQVAAVLAEDLYWHNEHPVVVPDELQYVDYRIQIQWSVDVREQASRALQVFVPDFSDHQVRVDAKEQEVVLSLEVVVGVRDSEDLVGFGTMYEPLGLQAIGFVVSCGPQTQLVGTVRYVEDCTHGGPSFC